MHLPPLQLFGGSARTDVLWQEARETGFELAAW